MATISGKIAYKVQLKTKSGVRLANEAMHALKQLSMLPDAEMGLAPRQDMGVGMVWTRSERGRIEGLYTHTHIYTHDFLCIYVCLSD